MQERDADHCKPAPGHERLINPLTNSPPPNDGRNHTFDVADILIPLRAGGLFFAPIQVLSVGTVAFSSRVCCSHGTSLIG